VNVPPPFDPKGIDFEDRSSWTAQPHGRGRIMLVLPDLEWSISLAAAEKFAAYLTAACTVERGCIAIAEAIEDRCPDLKDPS